VFLGRHDGFIAHDAGGGEFLFAEHHVADSLFVEVETASGLRKGGECSCEEGACRSRRESRCEEE
jgi:hypothetical protein